jgi:hypothetical protein
MLDNPHISRSGNASVRNGRSIDAQGITPSRRLKVRTAIRAGGIDIGGGFNHSRRLLP